MGEKQSPGLFFFTAAAFLRFKSCVSYKKAEDPKGFSAFLVRVTGLEPARRKTPDPKSGASAIPPYPRMLLFYHRPELCANSGLWFLVFTE